AVFALQKYLFAAGSNHAALIDHGVEHGLQLCGALSHYTDASGAVSGISEHPEDPVVGVLLSTDPKPCCLVDGIHADVCGDLARIHVVYPLKPVFNPLQIAVSVSYQDEVPDQCA